jgi:hypothetical protein
VPYTPFPMPIAREKLGGRTMTLRITAESARHLATADELPRWYRDHELDWVYQAIANSAARRGSLVALVCSQNTIDDLRKRGYTVEGPFGDGAVRITWPEPPAEFVVDRLGVYRTRGGGERKVLSLGGCSDRTVVVEDYEGIVGTRLPCGKAREDREGPYDLVEYLREDW